MIRKDYVRLQQGRSMVEMLGVLAIIGVLSVGGIAGYSMAMSKFKITQTIDQVQLMITNIRTYYASQRTYTPLTAKAAYEMGILTDESYQSSEGLNPYGGKIVFGTVGKREFTIEYTGLTAEACLKLATSDWGADASSELVSISVSAAGKVPTVYSWTGIHKLPPELTSAATACAGENTGDNTGAVKWTFR